MQIGIVGLGTMGTSMARSLILGGHDVIGCDTAPQKMQRLVAEGGKSVRTLEDMVEQLTPPRVIWLMLPAGAATIQTAHRLEILLTSGDTLIDGGNSFHKDSVRRSWTFAKKGLHCLDVGFAGGQGGADGDYCLMIGGSHDVYRKLLPIFETLAPNDGHLFCGGPGAGHFARMIHNAMEYGVMQVYAEGFSMLKDSRYADEINLSSMADLWSRNGVIRSWLLEMTAAALEECDDLPQQDELIKAPADGKWIMQQAMETGTPIPILAQSLMERLNSRQPATMRNSMLRALRQKINSHCADEAKWRD